MNSILIGLFLYLAIILLIGLKSTRKNKTHADFFIADRKLGAWAISLSERASGESAWLLLGLPGAAMAVGYLELWSVIGCLAGIIFSWMLIAKPLRELAGKYNSITLPDLFASHFSRYKTGIRMISSLIITFFFTLYVAAQFSGAGKALNITFGLSPFYGILIGAGVILLYTIMGGFSAVVWTDVVQAIIMFSTLVILPVVGFIELAGLEPNAVYSLSGTILSLTGNTVGLAAAMAILGGLSWGFGYTGQPHLLIRFMAINNSSGITKGRKIAFSWAIPAFLGAFLMGIVGYKLYGPDLLADSEHLMPYMATHLLPGWIAGILISGAMAAMMSTADSQLLITSSAVTEDLIHQIGKKELPPQRLLFISRCATILVGIAAFVLAITSKSLVFSLVSYAWSGLGASFGPLLLCILYWKKVTPEAAITGLLSGSISTVLWRNIDVLQDFVSERFATYLITFILIIVVTEITGKKYRRE